jgi:hypothetical protein
MLSGFRQVVAEDGATVWIVPDEVPPSTPSVEPQPTPPEPRRRRFGGAFIVLLSAAAGGLVLWWHARAATPLSGAPTNARWPSSVALGVVGFAVGIPGVPGVADNVLVAVLGSIAGALFL